MKALRNKIASGTREDCLGRKFHEECYYDFKAFVASPLTQFSMEVPRPFFYPYIIREFC